MNSRAFTPKLTSPQYLTECLLARSVAKFAGRVTGSIIDYGCGNRPYESLFDRATEYRGFDFDGEKKGCCSLGDDGRLPLADCTVDAVISTQVLEHVPTPEDYLTECRRVLRPGGLLLLSTHGNWPFHADKPCYSDYWRWTAEGLRFTLERSGFRVIEMEEVCRGVLSLLQQALVMRRWGVGRLGFIRQPLAKAVFFCVNFMGMLVFRLAPARSVRGKILPSDFVVLATPAP